MQEASQSHAHTAGNVFYIVYGIDSLPCCLIVHPLTPIWFLYRMTSSQTLGLQQPRLVHTLLNMGYLQQGHLLGLIRGFSPSKSPCSFPCKLP